MKLIQILTDIVCNTLLDPEALDRSRRRRGAFTRNCGKLPYWTVMKLLLKDSKRTVSACLDEFFRESGPGCGAPASCSQQAFSKARSGISHSIFRECFERMLDFLCSADSLSFHTRFMGLWGLQVIAIDGSKIPLPNRRALLEEFGGFGKGASSPTASASVAFDVLNERVIDAQLGPISAGEHTLAIRHMENIKSRARTDLLYTIFVFDRGYASKKMISYIEDTMHARYLFRLRSKFNGDIDALPAPEEQDGIADYAFSLYGRKVRVLKFYLSGGELETLITNETGLDGGMFRRLYFLRWPVEENYRLIKEKIGLTDFRGYSGNSVMQEFWISMLLANLSLAIKKEADGIIDCTINQKGNRHRYMANKNELVGCLCRRLPEYMDAVTLDEKFAVVKSLLSFAISHRVRDKKGSGESTPRRSPRKAKYYYNRKKTH